MTYCKCKDNIDDAFEVRRKVFMEEQGFQNEFEEKDRNPSMIHVTAYGDDGKLLGCARIFPSELEGGLQTKDGIWVFGRLCVIPEARKQGLGSKILEEAEKLAIAEGAEEMHLHAQCNAQSFYRKCGYQEYGPIEFDEHVEHQWMRKRLQCSPPPTMAEAVI